MPTRLCSQAGCPHPATVRGRCATHGRAWNKSTHRNRHVYNSKRWRILRRWFLFDNPLCTTCGTIATDVHHLKDISKGGDPWAAANLQALCHSCHSRITRQEQATP